MRSSWKAFSHLVIIGAGPSPRQVVPSLGLLVLDSIRIQTDSRELDGAPKVQLKSEESRNMSKEVKTMMETLTETAYLS